jgi:hypothetical protein
MNPRIAVLPGDGIGPEITAQAVKVLNALGCPFELEEAPVGGAGYAIYGHPLPERTLGLAKSADAILLGAVGDWQYDRLERPLRPEQAILGLRKHLALFANLRPAMLYPELSAASTLNAWLRRHENDLGKPVDADVDTAPLVPAVGLGKLWSLAARWRTRTWRRSSDWRFRRHSPVSTAATAATTLRSSGRNTTWRRCTPI